MLDFNAALLRIEAQATPLTGFEDLDLASAIGRYLACDVQAKLSVPGFANSAMDGYALRLSDWAADKAFAVSQRIPAGQAAESLLPGTVARIFTGAMLPPGADTVILQEDAQLLDQQVLFTAPATQGQHVRPAGQDIAAGAILATRGQRIGAALLGLLASAGFAKVSCCRRVSVAFFSTGDELVEPGDPLEAGQIYNSNRHALRQLVQDTGATAIDMGHCGDSPAATRAILSAAAERADCVISTGGMSVGEEDYVLAEAGRLGRIDFWKIAMKPGKPFASGKINGATFFGLPGNPVSAYVTFVLLVRPWLLKAMGSSRWQHTSIQASANFEFNNKGRRMDFLRGILRAASGEEADGKFAVSLYDNQSSGVMSSLVAANVLVPIAPHSQVTLGEALNVIPLPGADMFSGLEPWPA